MLPASLNPNQACRLFLFYCGAQCSFEIGWKGRFRSQVKNAIIPLEDEPFNQSHMKKRANSYFDAPMIVFNFFKNPERD